MIYEKFGLIDITEEEQQLIKTVDDALLYYEFIELMGISPSEEEAPEMKMEHDFSLRDFNEVEHEFLYIFNQLTNEKRRKDG